MYEAGLLHAVAAAARLYLLVIQELLTADLLRLHLLVWLHEELAGSQLYISLANLTAV
jgi:hypothetical protein